MSILKNPVHKLVTILVTVVFMVLLFAGVPLLLCVLAFRSFVWILAKYFRPDLDSFLTKENAFFAIYPPNTPNKSMNIIASGLINGQLTAQTTRRLFQERILNRTNAKNEFIYLRLKQTWTSFLGYAFWKTDQNFSLEKHVREYDYKGEFTLPNPCKPKDISKVLGNLTESPWTKNQSPWEVLLINNVILEGSKELKTCLIFKIDHVLCDGYSIQNIFKLLFNAKISMPNAASNQRSLSFLEKLFLILKCPYDTVGSIFTAQFSKRIYNVELSGKIISSVTPLVPVSLIKDIKNHYKVSYAAVLQSAVQGAIGRAMISAKMAVPKNLCAFLVLPIPNHPGGMTVHAQMIATELPCQADSSVERLYKTQKALEGISNSTAGLGHLLLNRLGAYYPMIVRRVINIAQSSTGMSYVISHFPVISSTVYFDGLELMEITLNLGTYLSMGMTIATGGTNNRQRITFNVDKNIFGSEEISSYLGPSVLKELQDLAKGIN